MIKLKIINGNDIYALRLVVWYLILGLSALTSQAQKMKKEIPCELSNSGAESFSRNYNTVITSEAQTDTGLFTVHKVDNTYYFEIPKSLLEKEILIVSKLSRRSGEKTLLPPGYTKSSDLVVRFQKEGNSLLMRSVSFRDIVDGNLNILKAVRNYNLEPIVYNFRIETQKDNDSSFVINVTDFFITDFPMISGLTQLNRQNLGISAAVKSQSLITSIKSFPENIEVKHILTYEGSRLGENNSDSGLISVEMNQSLIILPENPMIPRFHDERVGFFHIEKNFYGIDENESSKVKYINRWRLEPSDWTAFNRGELVQPKKPITYFIDPATPEKWVPYIKQGVLDWLKPFENIGFKDAIIVKVSPSIEEVPDFSPEDIKYSVIRYLASEGAGANGPYVSDPRTGEILEADIIFPHNALRELRNRFFVLTAAANPNARSSDLNDSTMGELIRPIIAHEVGHTLGLDHNMGASIAFSVDSLRSPSFTSLYGIGPSIMDYVRHNYVAQPGDSVTNFYPKVGEYDFWAVSYGYRPVKGIKHPKDEVPILNRWVEEKNEQMIYRWSVEGKSALALTEDIGDDAMEASKLGVQNLMVIMKNLIRWSTEDCKNYTDLPERYGEIITQYNYYMGHVIANLGGVYESRTTSNQEGIIYLNAPYDKQKRAMEFLSKYLFDPPEWLIDRKVHQRIGGAGPIYWIKSIYEQALNKLLGDEVKIKNMLDNEVLNGNSSYSFLNLMNDLRLSIFSELSSNSPIGIYRRNLQKMTVEKIGELINTKNNTIKNSDVPSFARATLITLKEQIKNFKKMRKLDESSRYHLQDLSERVEKILNNCAN